MKRRIVTVAAVVLCAIALEPGFSAAPDNDWELKRRRGGIEAYLRDYPGTELKEFRGVMYVRGIRLSSMVATFDDTSSYTRWMHNCTLSGLLKYFNVHERITYTVTHAPWPARDRDTVVYSRMTQNPDDLSVTIEITGWPDYVPKKKGRVRIPMMKALWTFRPLESGEVMVTYQTVTNPGGPLPLWLLNLSVIDLPFYTMEKFRSVAAERRYASAIYRVISEPVNTMMSAKAKAG
ncbi:MAG: START domain-containing protein [Spirochaetes bacterium]|nr:START domain-containing protein [Spirochaetota bacterium]